MSPARDGARLLVLAAALLLSGCNVIYPYQQPGRDGALDGTADLPRPDEAGRPDRGRADLRPIDGTPRFDASGPFCSTPADVLGLEFATLNPGWMRQSYCSSGGTAELNQCPDLNCLTVSDAYYDVGLGRSLSRFTVSLKVKLHTRPTGRAVLLRLGEPLLGSASLLSLGVRLEVARQQSTPHLVVFPAPKGGGSENDLGQLVLGQWYEVTLSGYPLGTNVSSTWQLKARKTNVDQTSAVSRSWTSAGALSSPLKNIQFGLFYSTCPGGKASLSALCLSEK